MEEVNKEYEEAVDRGNSIKDLLIEFFGEDKVDLQIPSLQAFLEDEASFRCNLYVYWPKVTITNENNESLDIDDLFAKMVLYKDGTLAGGFKLNRSTYSYTQFECNYMHSHVCDIPKGYYTSFQNPCLGDGPIRRTCALLNASFDLDIWQLFCLELDKYVHNESLNGGPYHRLSTVTKRELRFTPQRVLKYNTIVYREFGKYFATKLLKDGILKIIYLDGMYAVGMPDMEVIITISNAVIKYVNADPNLQTKSWGENLENIRDAFSLAVIKDGRILYKNSNDEQQISDLEHSPEKVLTFKGKDIYLKLIKDTEEDTTNYLTLLKEQMVESIIYYVVNFINYIAQSEYKYKSIGSNSISNSTPSTESRVIFI